MRPVTARASWSPAQALPNAEVQSRGAVRSDEYAVGDPSAAFGRNQRHGSSRIRGGTPSPAMRTHVWHGAHPAAERRRRVAGGASPRGPMCVTYSSPGGAMSRSRRGPPANVTDVPTSPRWGFAGRAKSWGSRPRLHDPAPPGASCCPRLHKTCCNHR